MRTLDRRARLAVIALGLLIVGGGCARVTGSSNVVSEARAVDPFTKVDVGGSYEVTVVAGESPQSVVLTGPDNLLPLIETRVDGHRLTINSRRGTSWSSGQPPRIVVHVEHLTGISASGASRVTASGIREDEFHVAASGAASLQVSGRALVVHASGAARADLSDLSAKKAEVDASGSARVDLAVSDKVTGSASGSATVGYRGDARSTVESSGAARVSKR